MESKERHSDHSTELSAFLQSPEWEELQRSLGRKAWRVNGTLVIQHSLSLGFNYLYCPRPNSGIWNLRTRASTVRGRQESGIRALNALRNIARQERSIFLKIDPIDDPPPEVGPRCFSSSIQPQKTVVLDLSKSEDELLAAMHPKTRYNTRLAERKGVAVTIHEPRNTNHEFAIFYELLRETSQRDNFYLHGMDHYQKLLAVRSPDFSNELFFANYDGKLLAAAMVNFYRSLTSAVATYLHGGSSREYREVMAPHLLHWAIIKEAKARGCRYYDLWGIDERKWPGLTRFKLGFGGEMVEYPPSLDIVYRPAWYRWYVLAKKLKVG